MKHISLVTFLSIAVSLQALAVTHTVSSAGFAFSPSTLTIALGDTVVFSLSVIHDAREVSQATWNANGTTSNGGFDVPFGGGMVVPGHAGTYYYICIAHALSGMKGTITVTPVTALKGDTREIPGGFALSQNYPNPFNPATMIVYLLPAMSRVKIDVVTADGRIVATLLDRTEEAGTGAVRWDGSGAASGTYFVRIRASALDDPAGAFTGVRKMILLR